MATSKARPPFSIQLAVDGSEHSLAGAQLICDLPLPPGSRVTIVSVLSPLQSPGRSTLLAAQAKVKDILKGVEAEVDTGLLHGNPAQALVDFAEEHRPDLMIVGARGLRATLGILLGGVAQQIVEYAHWPVGVVRAPYLGLHRVLLVVDGSSYSQHATDYLTRLPLPATTEVRAMYVLPPPPPPYLPGSASPFGVDMPPLPTLDLEEVAAREAQAEEEAGQALLAQVTDTLAAAGIKATSILEQGDAATQIIDHVKAQDIDLVVAGSRGLGAVRGWLLGSVSRKLVHYAGCSALIVRTESGAAD